MRIFDKRPLSLILCVTLGSFVFFTLCANTTIKIHFLVFLVLVCVATFIKRVPFRNNRTLIRIASICAMFAFIFSSLYFNLWFRAYERYDGDVEIEGTVMELDTGNYQSTVLLKADIVNNTPLSSYKLLVYVDSDIRYDLALGNKIKLVANIESFASDGDFDAETYYTARGISGVVYEVSDLEITSAGKLTLEHKITAARTRLCERIVRMSSSSSGGLLCALLLGEKSLLPLGTRLDFSRIGISHILALSGMHLAIIAVGFSKILMFFGVKKKAATAITIAFTIFYMTLTGFPISVVRAGIMLIVSSLLFLFAKSRDSMTSLFISVSLICVIEPYAIYDTSLWLSAFATLGIVVMSEYTSQKYSKPSALKWVLTSFISSLFAISATFIITTLTFDGTSLLAPLATLVFSVLCEFFIYAGILLLLFGAILPIKFVFNPYGDLIIALAKWASGLEWAYVSTNFTVIEILAFFYCIGVFLFFVLKIKRKNLYLIISAASLTFILGLSGLLSVINSHNDRLIYSPVSEERIIITDGGEISVTDISVYKKNTAYSLYHELTDLKICEIDKYVVTHYTSGLYDSLTTLSGLILVRELYLPIPTTEDEAEIYFNISNALKGRTNITIYENEDIIKAGKYSILPLYNSPMGETRKNLITIFDGNAFHTYLNADALDGETKNMALEVIAGSKTIIFGRHESSGSIYKFAYEIESAKKLIFSSERVLPDEEALEYYDPDGIYVTPDKMISLIR